MRCSSNRMSEAGSTASTCAAELAVMDHGLLGIRCRRSAPSEKRLCVRLLPFADWPGVPFIGHHMPDRHDLLRPLSRQLELAHLLAAFGTSQRSHRHQAGDALALVQFPWLPQSYPRMHPASHPWWYQAESRSTLGLGARQAHRSATVSPQATCYHAGRSLWPVEVHRVRAIVLKNSLGRPTRQCVQLEQTAPAQPPQGGRRPGSCPRLGHSLPA